MTHYEVLGVEPTASADEIRRVYLDLARRHHPDFHEDAATDTRTAAERRMQRINDAWAVLGDRDRRAAYDATLGGGRSGTGVVADVPTRSWRPIDPDDDGVDPRDLVDDRPIGDGGRPPRALTLAPAIFFAISIGAFSVGFVTRIGFLVGLGLVAAVLTVLSLVAAPAVALAKSWQSERI